MKKLLVILVITIALSLSGLAQKKPASKTGPIDETTYSMTIEHNGEKTEVKHSQFKTHGGTSAPDGSVPNRLLFMYGASNDIDDKSFSFNGWIPATAKGTYTVGNGGAGFSLMTTAFPDVPIFLVKSGSYEITAVPLKGGFVEGTFSMICENITNEGKVETYNISGAFKVLRQ